MKVLEQLRTDYIWVRREDILSGSHVHAGHSLQLVAEVSQELLHVP